MVLELRIREKALSAQLKRDRESRLVHSQLGKQHTSNEKRQQRIDALGTAKESLERELDEVLRELQMTREQRIELEDASRKERAQRQKDAEKQLHARVRTEEWNRMADEEKVRAEVAADARARAGQRVVSRATSLRKKAHEAQEAWRPSRNNSNNNSDEDDGIALPTSGVKIAGSTPGAKSSLLLTPELAEFEEEGLLDTSNIIAFRTRTRLETSEATEVTENDSIAPTAEACPETHDEASGRNSTSSTFVWSLPLFDDRELFTRVLIFEIPSP